MRLSRHFHPCAHITLWLRVSHDVSAKKHVHPQVITCLRFCCFLVLSFSSLVPLLFLSLLPLLSPELQLPCCRDRRALNPMRTRKMRSHHGTLSQVVSPTSSTTSSTTSTTQRLAIGVPNVVRWEWIFAATQGWRSHCGWAQHWSALKMQPNYTMGEALHHWEQTPLSTGYHGRLRNDW